MEKTTQRNQWMMVLVLFFVVALGQSQTVLSQRAESGAKTQGKKNSSKQGLARVNSSPAVAPSQSPESPPSSSLPSLPQTRSAIKSQLSGLQAQQFYNAIYTIFGVGSGLLGLLAGWFLATRLKLQETEHLNPNAKARRKFWSYLGIFGALWLLAYLVSVYGYEYFGHIIQLVANLQFFWAVLEGVAAFVGVAALATRFWPRSRCPYILIPK